MSAFPSTYSSNKLLDHLVRHTSYTSPTTVYLALYTSNPGPTNTGTEATGGSYARQDLAWSAASGGSIAMTGTETFSAMAAGTYTHYGVFDASTSGNLLIYGALPNSIVTNAGDDITISVLTFTLTGS